MAARLQTKVYLSLLAKAGAHLNGGQPFSPEQVEMVYWYADFPSEPSRFRYDSARYKLDWDGITALIQEIVSKQSYPLTDDEQKCGFCPYRSFCERGISAGKNEDIEAEPAANWDVNLVQIQEIEF